MMDANESCYVKFLASEFSSKIQHLKKAFLDAKNFQHKKTFHIKGRVLRESALFFRENYTPLQSYRDLQKSEWYQLQDSLKNRLLNGGGTLQEVLIILSNETQIQFTQLRKRLEFAKLHDFIQITQLLDGVSWFISFIEESKELPSEVGEKFLLGESIDETSLAELNIEGILLAV
ncbi:MAG: hypothetical protein ACI86H_001100 [bacterium]|jgi:hypothetical protein